MNEEANPISTLTTALGKLVDERRALAVSIALGYRRRRSDDPQTGEMREVFVGLQNTIEAIDRAIAHEKLIATDTARNDSRFAETDLRKAATSQDCHL